MIPDLDPDTDLILTREIAAPRALIYTCWTTPEHLIHWFVPKPHCVTACALDVRVGGRCNTTFEVDGNLHQNNGVYLEVIPNEKLVFTDTYTEGWKPAPEPFMTAILTFEDAGPGRTRYTAIARHRPPPLERDRRTAQGDGVLQWMGHGRRSTRSLCPNPLILSSLLKYPRGVRCLWHRGGQTAPLSPATPGTDPNSI